MRGIRKLRDLECNEGYGPYSEIIVSSWCDGGIGQISRPLSKKLSNKDKSCETIKSKHRPKRNGRGAGCDLINSFKSMKNGAKMLTMRSDTNALNSSQISNATEHDSRVSLKNIIKNY